jgi:hypothetical protein
MSRPELWRLVTVTKLGNDTVVITIVHGTSTLISSPNDDGVQRILSSHSHTAIYYTCVCQLRTSVSRCLVL